MMNKKIHGCSEIALFFAVVLCSFGVCFAAKSGFGVSMVVAPAYVIYCKVSTVLPWFTLGMSEYGLQALLLVMTGIAVRRFKVKYILSFVTSFIYGLMLDFWRIIFGTEQYTQMTDRILSSALGIVAVALAVALYLRTYLPQSGYEMVVAEFANVFKFNMNKVKWIYDISSLSFAIIVMLIFFKRFDFSMVGPATLIITVINTPLIALFGWLMEKVFVFDAKFLGFKAKYDRFMD